MSVRWVELSQYNLLQLEVIHYIIHQDFPAGPTQPGRWQDSCSRYAVKPTPKPRSELKDGVQIGLLPRDNEEQIPFAYRLYKRTDKVGRQLAAGYKQTFCTPVAIDFVGVWCVPPGHFHSGRRSDEPTGILLRVLGYSMTATCPLPRTTRR